MHPTVIVAASKELRYLTILLRAWEAGWHSRVFCVAHAGAL